jgi:hypothetical protein
LPPALISVEFFIFCIADRPPVIAFVCTCTRVKAVLRFLMHLGQREGNTTAVPLQYNDNTEAQSILNF